MYVVTDSEEWLRMGWFAGSVPNIVVPPLPLSPTCGSCALSCGSCAGPGCSSRPGGADACCGGGVKATQGLCSDTGEAPCVIDTDTVDPVGAN